MEITNPIIIYTDGSYLLHGTRQAGWAAIGFLSEDCAASAPLIHIGGKLVHADSGTAELTALVEAINAAPLGSTVTVCGDCLSVLKVASGIVGTISDDTAPLPQKNRALWERLRDLLKYRTVTFRWVRGHAGNPGHTAAHRLARSFARA